MLTRVPPDRTPREPRKPRRPSRNADAYFLILAFVASTIAAALIVVYALFIG